MRWLRHFLTVLMAIVPILAIAQINPTEWSSKPGKMPGTIEVTASIQDGWYMYGTRSISDGPFPTTFKSADEKFEVLKGIEEPGIKQKLDPGFEKEVDYFEKSGTYVVPLKALGAERKGDLTVTFQACNKSGCLPPQDVTFPVELVGDFAGTAATQSADSDVPISQVEKAKAAGLLTFFGTGDRGRSPRTSHAMRLPDDPDHCEHLRQEGARWRNRAGDGFLSRNHRHVHSIGLGIHADFRRNGTAGLRE